MVVVHTYHTLAENGGRVSRDYSIVIVVAVDFLD